MSDSEPRKPQSGQDGGGISMQGLKAEIDQLKREVQRIKDWINEKNDPGGVGKAGL
jgi:hypothetical protein